MKFFLLFIVGFLMNAPSFASQIELPHELKNKTISLIIGYGPGGRNDLFARYLTNVIKEKYNINIVIVNRPGASGAIGAKFVAESNPDGTILHIANDAFVIGSLQSAPSWPQQQELIPVAHLWKTYNMVIGSKHLKFDNIKDVINDMNKNAAQYNYATVFVADGMQFAAILKHHNITGVAPVPFKSGPEIKTALANNTVQFWITGVGDGISTVNSGIAKPLAVTSEKRMAQLESVPTLNEFMPNSVFQNVTTLYLPAKTPESIVSFYNELFKLISTDAEVVKHFTELYYDLIPIKEPKIVLEQSQRHWNSVKSYLGK